MNERDFRSFVLFIYFVLMKTKFDKYTNKLKISKHTQFKKIVQTYTYTLTKLSFKREFLNWDFCLFKFDSSYLYDFCFVCKL